MTDAELTRMETLAASATNGPWHVWVKDPDIVCHSNENADYIAAVSPGVVLRLVAEVRRLRRHLSAQQRFLAPRLRHQRDQVSKFDGQCACSDCALARGGQ